MVPRCPFLLFSPVLTETLELSDKAMIIEQWAEHFKHVLKGPPSINTKVIGKIHQAEMNSSLTHRPTTVKIHKDSKLLPNSKAPGSDYPCRNLPCKRNPQFQSMWNQNVFPQEYKDVSFIQLYKRKGNRQVFNDHQGISLFITAGKITATILPSHPLKHLKHEILPGSECNFRVTWKC